MEKAGFLFVVRLRATMEKFSKKIRTGHLQITSLDR
jgi:hypothetical protein